jgi:hypothetical protein
MKTDHKQFWITATELKRLTNWDHEQMRAARKNNPYFWKQITGKSYLYDASMVPESLIKKEEIKKPGRESRQSANYK